MPWLSRNNFTPTDKLHSDDLNALANDDRTWGGNVNGGGYTLSNVNIVAINPTAGGGGVTSFNTRNGDVLPGNNDYTAAMVGAVPLTRQIITGDPAVTGLTGGGPLSTDLNLTAKVVSVFGRTGIVALNSTDISTAGGVLKTQKLNTALGSGLQGGGPYGSADLNLSVVPNSSNQQIQVMSQGNPIGAPRHAINFISGTGSLVTVQEISASDRIDVTVQSTGTGGFVDPTQIQGDLIVRGVSAPATRLAVGTADGQVLTVDHLAPLGVKWAPPAATNAVTSVFGRFGAVIGAAHDYTAAQVDNAVDQQGAYNNPPWIKSLAWNVIAGAPAFMLDPTQGKGDLIVHAQTGTTRLIPGSNGSILTADDSIQAGVKWAAPPIKSFNTRGDAVVPGPNDYTVDMIAGAVPTSRAINTVQAPPSGLTGGGPLSGNLSLSVVPDTTNQQIEIWQEGVTKIATRHALNFKAGAGVALTIVDSPPTTGSNWINITIASSGTGSGGGLVDPTSNKGDLIVKPTPPTPPAALAVGPNGYVLTADSTQGLGMRWAQPTAGGAGSQTPWIGDVNAATFNLNNAGGIGVNIASDITKARVLAFVNALEDGLQVKTSSAAALAAASFINNAGDTLTLRSYGSGFVGGLPGLASIEASNILAIFANSAEVMRLKAGRVLIGTTTDDGVNKLQVNGKVKSLTGGFVFPDGSTQVVAFTPAASAVTSVFTRTGAILAQAHDYTAALVDNAVDSSVTYNDPAWMNTLAWSKITGKPPALFLDPTTTKGDLIARGTAAPATRFPVGTTNGMVLTVDSTDATFGVKWAAPPAQSPWVSDINAAGNQLNNLGAVVITGTFDAGNVANSFGLDQSGGAGRLVSWGPDTITNGKFMFVSLRSDGSGTVVPMMIVGANTGVGTITPTNRLTVGVGTQYDGIVLKNASGTTLGQMLDFGANGGLQLMSGATTVVSIQAGGDSYLNGGSLGIGIAPSYKLHLYSPGIVQSVIESSDSSGGGYVIQGFYTPSYKYELGAGATGSGFANKFYVFDRTAGVTRMLFDSAGNCGLGTSTPNSLLHLNRDPSGAGAVGAAILLNRAGSNLYGGGIWATYLGDGLDRLQFGVGNNLSPTSNPVMTILCPGSAVSGGTVGIGLNTPVGKCQVEHPAGTLGFFASNSIATWGTVANFNAHRFFKTYSAATDGSFKAVHVGPGGIAIGFNTPTYGSPDAMWINGNVAIGLEGGFGALHVSSLGSANSGGIVISNGNSTDHWKMYCSAGQDQFFFGYNSIGAGGWYNGNIPILTFGYPNDRIGVRNTNPQYTIDVVGDVHVSGRLFVANKPIAVIKTQNIVTGSRALNTNYQNNNQYPIFVSVYCIVNSGSFIKLNTDSGNPPTYTVFASTNTYTNTAGYSASGWVMPGHWYRADTPGASLTSWTEWN